MYWYLPFTDKETGSEWLSTFLKVTQVFVVGWVSQAADCGRDWPAGLTGCALGIHAWGSVAIRLGRGEDGTVMQEPQTLQPVSRRLSQGDPQLGLELEQRGQAIPDVGSLLDGVPHGQGCSLWLRAVPEEGLSFQQMTAQQLQK